MREAPIDVEATVKPTVTTPKTEQDSQNFVQQYTEKDQQQFLQKESEKEAVKAKTKKEYNLTMRKKITDIRKSFG